MHTGFLTVLRGVAVPVASAVLTLVCPEQYAVVDFRVWRQVVGHEKHSFTVADYKRYMNAIPDLAGTVGLTAQEVDAAIWEYDRQRYGISEG